MNLDNKPKVSLKDIYKILSPWWRSSEKYVAVAGFGVLLILGILSVYISVRMNVWNRDIFDSIEQKKMAAFIHFLILFVPLLLCSVIRFCISEYLRSWLKWRWRRWYTEKISHQWLQSGAYYALQLGKETSDNPDQRITADINTICYFSLDLALSLFREVINLFTFASILWGLCHSFKFTFFHQTFTFPGFLVWIALLYAATATVITFKIGRPLIRLNYFQEKLEANLRYKLMRIKERREEISQLKGEPIEENQFINAFDDLKINYYQIIKRSIYLNAFQGTYQNVDTLVPIILVTPQFMLGIITFGVLMQIANIFSQVQSSMSVLASSYQGIAEWLAALYRIKSFQEGIDATANAKKIFNPEGDNLRLKDIKIYSPQEDLIIHIPSVELNPGQKIILTGHSGIGKSSLVRMLSGNYRYYTGELSYPKDPLFILPQRPYMPIGSLKQVISYPSKEDSFSVDRILDVMIACKLPHLCKHLNNHEDWQERLSIGEQQRIGFARALLHEPKWLLMDEPFANLNEHLGKELGGLVVSKLPDSAMLIISHQLYCSDLFDEVIHFSLSGSEHKRPNDGLHLISNHEPDVL